MAYSIRSSGWVWVEASAVDVEWVKEWDDAWVEEWAAVWAQGKISLRQAHNFVKTLSGKKDRSKVSCLDRNRSSKH